MKTLLEDYKRRLETANEMLKQTDRIAYPIKYARIETKISCYRTIIAELDRELKPNENNWSRAEVIQLCLKMQHEYPKFCSESHYQPNLKEITEWTDNWIDNNL